MKLFIFYCWLLMISCITEVIGQKMKEGSFVRGEVIIHFQDGILDPSQLEATSTKPPKLNISSAIRSTKMIVTLDSIGNVQISKLVRKSSHDQRVSISRTGEEVRIPDFYNMMILHVSEDIDIPKLCKKLEKLPEILYAEPNFIMNNNAFTPNDPSFNSQRGLEQLFGDADIDVTRAWDFTKGSSSVKVGIIDSGIDYHHPDLGGNFGSSAPKVKGGYDYVNSDGNPDDNAANSHGTAVAGIVGALTNNGIGIAGIAGGDGAIGNPGVQLFALKIGENGTSFSHGDAIDAIYDGSTSVSSGGYGCHILNFSGGALASEMAGDPLNGINSYRKALSYAAQNGVIFVAAKGNHGISNQKYYPADYTDNLVISVGASNVNDLRATSSNYGNGMDFVAPGTTDITYTTKRLEQFSYGSFDLTSASAPVVAGIASLLKSVNINLHRDDVEKLIELSADKVNPGVYSYVNGYNEQMGHGRVNAGRALELLHSPYLLQQHTTTGGASQKITNGGGEWLSFFNDAGNSLPEGAYYGEMYQVTKTVNIPQSLCNEKYV